MNQPTVQTQPTPEFSNDPLKHLNPHNAHSVHSVRQEILTQLLALQAWENKHSSLRGIKNCGVSPRRGNGEVNLNLRYIEAKARAFMEGLQTCKSMMCVRCSTVIQYKNRLKILMTAEAHILAGGTILFGSFGSKSNAYVTPTFYSQAIAFERSREWEAYANPEDPTTRKTKALYKQLFTAWAGQHPRQNSWERWGLFREMNAQRAARANTFGSNRGYREDKAKFGIEGFVVAPELRVTLVDGWKKTISNPHIHFLLFVKGNPTNEDVQALTTRLSNRWAHTLSKHGVKALPGVQDLRVVSTARSEDMERVAQYITKVSYNLMSVAQAEKIRSDGNRSYSEFQALQAAAGGFINDDGTVTAGDPDALRWWNNLEGIQYGQQHRRLYWSRDIRSTYGVEAEIKEANREYAEASIVERVLTLTSTAWKQLRNFPSKRAGLLNICENSLTPQASAAAWLAGEGFVEGLDFYVPVEPFWEPLTPADEQLYSTVELPF